MIRLQNTSVMNFEHALRGARNPKNSWARMDSYTRADGTFVLGPNDRALAQRLCRAGSDHRKFLRQIGICVDITAPLYWWKEFDTYKIGTAANSTSTMHRIHARPITLTDFSTDQLNTQAQRALSAYVQVLEQLRLQYVEQADRQAWYSLIQLLPSSYEQMRTCTMNYEAVFRMAQARRTHKLAEWQTFCTWAEGLPHFRDFFGDEPSQPV